MKSVTMLTSALLFRWVVPSQQVRKFWLFLRMVKLDELALEGSGGPLCVVLCANCVQCLMLMVLDRS